MQFFDRIKLFGMPSKHQPDLIYLRYVPLWKVHIFTLVQLTCLVLLWVIKASAAAVVFPMMVLTATAVSQFLHFTCMLSSIMFQQNCLNQHSFFVNSKVNSTKF